VSGAFTTAGGEARANLAHLMADASVDSRWNPSANGAVSALTASGSTIYAGGEFRAIAGKARGYIAALNARTGRATSARTGEVTGWNPNANGPVDAFAVSGSTVYAGGYITLIGAS
jgi:hypothetical protein